MAINTDRAQSQAAELSSQLWSIADDLRGGMDANEFRNYILTVQTVMILLLI